ncbi:PGAP1-like alpha/beta domain-containing protein [Spirosoma areae]
MAKIVAIHGIGQQYVGGHTLHSSWYPALCDGLRAAGKPEVPAEDLELVFYGDLFRPAGTKAGIPLIQPDELTEEEAALLMVWWQEAARLSELARQGQSDESTGIQPPEFVGKASVSPTVQRALLQLSKSRFFAAFGGERLLVFGLRQVRKFLHDAVIKAQILERVANTIKPDTRVLVGHSLGAIVGYEALCANPGWPVETLVTLGSPLGIPNLVFDVLTPKPNNGRGVWPAHVRQWVNIADSGDIVALNKQIAPLFGNVTDVLTDNGWQSHDAIHYLTSREAGEAIGSAL